LINSTLAGRWTGATGCNLAGGNAGGPRPIQTLVRSDGSIATPRDTRFRKKLSLVIIKDEK